MTEKYFAATPYTCHNQFLISIKNVQWAIENCIMAYGCIMLKLKDFEGIYATADKKISHFNLSGLHRCMQYRPENPI